MRMTMLVRMLMVMIVGMFVMVMFTCRTGAQCRRMRVRDHGAIGQRMGVRMGVTVRINGLFTDFVRAGLGAAAFLAHK